MCPDALLKTGPEAERKHLLTVVSFSKSSRVAARAGFGGLCCGPKPAAEP